MSLSFGVNLIVTLLSMLFLLKRFQEILRMRLFDDAVTKRHDRFQIKYNLYEKQSSYGTIQYRMHMFSEQMTAEEQRVTLRGRCSLRQYIPSKPLKYIVKF